MAKRTVKETELQFRLYYKVLDTIGAIFHNAVPWICLVAIAYFVRDATASIAGRNTIADIGMQFLGDFRVSDSLAYVFGAGGVGYGAWKHRLYGNHVQRTSKTIKDLEARIDPGRSSSRLAPRGETSPEDKP